MLTDFHEDEEKQIKMAQSPNSQYFLRKFQGFALGLVSKIDAKGFNVAQPIWLSVCQI